MANNTNTFINQNSILNNGNTNNTMNGFYMNHNEYQCKNCLRVEVLEKKI